MKTSSFESKNFEFINNFEGFVSLCMAEGDGRTEVKQLNQLGIFVMRRAKSSVAKCQRDFPLALHILNAEAHIP